MKAGRNAVADVKAGYKRTEVGVIPEDWDDKELGSILLNGRLGGNYPNQVSETSYPLMKMGNLARGYIDLQNIEYIPECITPAPEHQLHFGDVLFNTRNTLDLVGKVAIWHDELPLAFYNSNLMRLEFDPKKIGSNEFANYVLNSQRIVTQLRNIATGTTSVAAIYTRDLLKIVIPHPRIDEQRAIATALSDADARITSLDQLIAKKRDIRQAAMRELLTGKRRLPGFSGEWARKRLGDLCHSINDGTHYTPNYVNDGVPFYSVENVTADDFVNTKFISRDAHEQLIKRCMPEKGDILLTRIGSIGDTKLIDWDVEASIYVSLALLKVNKKVDRQYLYCYTRSNQFQKDIEARSLLNATPKKINMIDIGGVPISLPPLEEQRAIATVLSDMDAELAALEQQRDKMKNIKQGMMQELLTGRIRLT